MNVHKEDVSELIESNPASLSVEYLPNLATKKKHQQLLKVK